MALTALVNPSSLPSSTKDIHKEFHDIHRSHSSRDLSNHANIQGIFSSADNHVCYCINRIQPTLTDPERKKNPFMGISSFSSREPIIPNLLRSCSFDPDSSKHMNIVENDDLNQVESSGESSEGEELKKTSWLESLLELGRNNWKNTWEKKAVSGTHNYGDEERRYRSYDRHLFSRFLVHVPWSDTKSFSRLAFLCNLAYIIPEIKATDFKRYYGLEFMTTSLDKHAPVDRTEVAGENGGSLCQNHKSKKYENIPTSMMSMPAEADEEKKGAAKEIHSLPCEWFVCDDPATCTRIFVIQGIHSLASWQAYFFFEPTEFEGTSVLVHRGIYELAKKLYLQFTPKIIDHLARHGELAKFQFTGHCLGGSLSVIVHLMLLTRKLVEPSALLPVVTFGSAYVFCGGQKILEQLELDECDHIRSVMLPRDIVPRSFSSNYPNHVAAILKQFHGPFESHPCLTKKKMLYSPIGKLYIVQPCESSSPPHRLLPVGSGLYALDSTLYGFSSRVLRAFLNSPHPLDTLSDPRAYGSEGTIVRDHDSSNYLKALNWVLRLHTWKTIRTVRRQRNVIWPLLTLPSPKSWNYEDESSI